MNNRRKASAPAASRDAAVSAFIGLGANLGEAEATLRRAATELGSAPGIFDCRLAPFYRSAPVDADGPDYINTVAGIRTTRDPWQLLDLLQAIENKHGRVRSYRNAPRTLDLDLLLYADWKIDDTRLTVPHRRMHERAFVLLPLADLEPDLVLAHGAIQALAHDLHQPITRIASPQHLPE